MNMNDSAHINTKLSGSPSGQQFMICAPQMTRDGKLMIKSIKTIS